MAKKKGKTKRKGPPRMPKSASELLIERKAQKFIQAVKEYWAEQDKLHRQFNETSASFGARPKGSELFPSDPSGVVWLLKDGLVFVRFKTSGDHLIFQTRFLDITVTQWLQELWLIPAGNKDVSLVGFFRGSSNITIVNCTFDGLHIDYAHVSHVYYDSPEMAPDISIAVADFKLTVLGMIVESGNAVLATSREAAAHPDTTVARLAKITDQYRGLLSANTGEEEIQSFLKKNPFLLMPASEVIPKKQLGEDFVTDFVLLNILDQGPSYTLVEIERASHKVLTKERQLTARVSHALMQTREWDIWLEKYKAYIQGKLPGFESPKYLVVIGRSNQMDEDDRAFLRSYNRMFANVSLLTYDDLLKQAEEFLASLDRATAQRSEG